MVAAGLNSLYPGARKTVLVLVGILLMATIAGTAYYFTHLTGMQAFTAQDEDVESTLPGASGAIINEPTSNTRDTMHPVTEPSPKTITALTISDTSAPKTSSESAAPVSSASSNSSKAAATTNDAQAASRMRPAPRPSAAQHTKISTATPVIASAKADTPTPLGGSRGVATVTANTDAGTQRPWASLAVLGVDYLMDGQGAETLCVRLDKKYIPNLHPLENRVFFNFFGVEKFDGLPTPPELTGVVTRVRAHLHPGKRKLTMVMDLKPGVDVDFTRRFEPADNRFCATATPK